MLPDGWKKVTVEDLKAPVDNALATGPFGSSIGSRYFQSYGVPVIRGGNLSEDVSVRLNDEGLIFVSEKKAAEFKRSLVRAGDLIFTCWGTINQVGLIDDRAKFAEYIISNKQMKFTPDPEKASSLFLYYLFSSPQLQEQIKNEGIGSSVPGFNLGQLRTIQLKIPNLDEQRAIAHILGTLDDKIELNRRMNGTLEAIARAIFQSWFVDFDPVRAKCRGEACLAPTLPQSIADLFPDSFEDSELGEIPKGWRVKKLSDVTLQITKGTTPTQEDIRSASVTDTHVNYLRVNAISEYGSFLYDKLTTIPESVHKGALKRSILRANDIVYTIAGTIGRIAVIGQDLLPANTNQAVAIIRSKSEVSPVFLVFAMRQQAFQEELHSKIVHAVQANLSLGIISEAKIIFPPEALFAKILNPIEEIVKKITANRAQSRTLATLRDTLLPKLISGELRVKEAERFIGRAV